MENKNYPMTPEQFAAKQQELIAAGQAAQGPTGKLIKDSIELDYAYDGKNVSITLVNAGGYPHFMVWHEVNKWLT